MKMSLLNTIALSMAASSAMASTGQQAQMADAKPRKALAASCVKAAAYDPQQPGLAVEYNQTNACAADEVLVIQVVRNGDDCGRRRSSHCQDL